MHVAYTKYHPAPGGGFVLTDRPHWYLQLRQGGYVQEAWFVTKPTKRQLRKFKRTAIKRKVSVVT